ncbi:MAG: hypothetical protein KJ737_15620 [Proteobacteria bacterium]|nr:hypothetical protein [Pseudomonadota bacterium]
MKSLAQQGEWESINAFFYETGLMLTKSTAVLSCMTGGVPNFSTCFNLPLDIYLLGGDVKEARSAEKALDAIDKFLRNFQNILQKNENNNFSISPYRVSILKREFEEICRAIDQECMEVSDSSSQAPPASATGDPWESAPPPALPSAPGDPWVP